MPENAGSPKRQTQVEDAKCRLERAIDKLMELPDMWRVALEKVLRPEEGLKAPIGEKTESMTVPLVSRINHNSSVIEGVAANLCEIRSRMEL